MIAKHKNPAGLIVFTAALLMSGLNSSAKPAPASIRAPSKPMTTRVHEADKVFVAEVVNRKLLKDDWCHADLKVIKAIKGVKLGELVPVVWRPKVGHFNTQEDQLGLAILKPAHEKRYWLRLDTFVDRALAEQAEWLEKMDGIIRQYENGAILTKEQEKVVIELAQKRGIDMVAKITTYYRRPSSDRGISVYGVEQVVEREVSYPMLTVTYKDWNSMSKGPKKGDLQSGDFWAGKAVTRKTTILMVEKKEYRVGSPRGLSIEQCESILKRLQNRKFTLAEGQNAERIKGVDWNSPQSFSKFGENINVSFSAQGGDGWYSLKISLIGDQLVINKVMLAMP